MRLNLKFFGFLYVYVHNNLRSAFNIKHSNLCAFIITQTNLMVDIDEKAYITSSTE